MCLCRQGIADGEADFSFAKRNDGTVKEMKGALGGLRVVPSQRHGEGLLQRIEEVWVCIARA